MAEQGDTNKHWPLVGNEHVVDFLSRSLAQEDIAGSYIFLGPHGLGKTTIAKFFLKNLLCEHRKQGENALPCEECSSCRQMNNRAEEGEDLSAVHSDYHLVKKEADKKNISIEQIREFTKILSMSSFLNSYKAGIIKDAESLTLEAANALLKTLEEPKQKVTVILIASDLENIPDTVVSRSRVINFYPAPKDKIYDYLLNDQQASRSMAKNLAHLSLGRPALGIKFLQEKDFLDRYREKAEIFLDLLGRDLNEREEQLGRIIGDKASGRENHDQALNIIEIWRGVARDILLLNSRNRDLIQHEILKEKLEQAAAGFSSLQTLKMIGVLQKGEKQIESNVNPKLVLQNIVYNIG